MLLKRTVIAKERLVAVSRVASTTTAAVMLAATSWSHVGPVPLLEAADSLRMQEAFALNVPDSFALTGLAAYPHNVVLAWASNVPYVMQFENGNRSILGQGVLRRPLGAAPTGRDGGVEVVDAGRQMLSTFGPRGQHLSDVHLRSPLTVLSRATKSPMGWLIVGHDALGVCRLLLKTASKNGRDSSEWREFSRVTRALRPNECAAAQISLVQDGIVISHAGRPFKSELLGLDGRLRSVFSPMQASNAPFARGGTNQLWGAMPLLPAGQHYLQVLTDLRANRRVLLVYTNQGAVKRLRTVEAPFGLSAAVAEDSLVVGARRVNSVQIVGYRWRWNSF